ncbi:hypothetical protein C1645_876373 [Glomus cerebriforme]|uniref:BTB domain-containing protein n=1 Tax=Glomus cerebriforme TaxID=658196 RepID=A0A397T171_9GLOM|nr:hypothetical protein C1645_876373 [Glomus cerebriforme]
MAIPTKIKKFFGKCKKPFVCISKLSKKSKKDSTIIKSSSTNTIATTNATTITNIPIKEEIIVKEIKVDTAHDDIKITLPERQQNHFISSKEKEFSKLDTKPQQPIQHSFSTTKNNNYKRYSINNIFNKSRFAPPTSAVTPSFIHPVAIKLNVGGITYMTTQQTLCTYPSYLSELFFLFRSPNLPPSSTHSQYPWPEELFIDRDGELFIHILSFLRNGTLPYTIPLSILQKLEYEARFYGIKPLQNLISHRVQIHTSSPKFKVIPIERLNNNNNNNNENDFDVNDEIIEIAAKTSGLRRSTSSSYSISSLHHRRRINSDNMSLNSNSSGDSSEVVPIIYNPCNTTSTSHTPTTNYTRTPKSSTSTTSKNNFYVSSSPTSQNCNYKPEYEIISITKIPIILNDNNYTFDNFDHMNYLNDEEFHTKELATFVVLQRKDE